MARFASSSTVPIVFEVVKSSIRAEKVKILAPRPFTFECWLPKSQLGPVSKVQGSETTWTTDLPKWLYDAKYNEDLAAIKSAKTSAPNPDEVNRKLAELKDSEWRPTNYGDDADRFD